MFIRDSIFDDADDQHDLPVKIGDHYRVFPQVPLSKVVDLTDPSPLTLSVTEQVLLEEAHIDTVVCDLSNRPLIAVDCDVRGYGFNDQGKYVQLYPTVEVDAAELAARSKIMHAVRMPYVITGPECLYPVTPDIDLTILDGLVGRIIATQEYARAERDPELAQSYLMMYEDLRGSSIEDSLRLEMAIRRTFSAVYRRYHDAMNDLAVPPMIEIADIIKTQGSFGPQFTLTTRIDMPELGTGQCRVVMNRYSHDGDDLAFGFTELAEQLGYIAAAARLRDGGSDRH